jgi:hypothetical protein
MKNTGRTIDERVRAAREQVFVRYFQRSGRQM